MEKQKEIKMKRPNTVTLMLCHGNKAIVMTSRIGISSKDVIDFVCCLIARWVVLKLANTSLFLTILNISSKKIKIFFKIWGTGRLAETHLPEKN
jgi:hypothetical protein